MIKYIYGICRYDSSECSEIWHGYFSVPDIVGFFCEDNLNDAIKIVETNATDLFEGCYDFITIEKVPLGTLYYGMYIEERQIYYYDGSGIYKFITSLKGREVVSMETERIVKKVLADSCML